MLTRAGKYVEPERPHIENSTKFHMSWRATYYTDGKPKTLETLDELKEDGSRHVDALVIGRIEQKPIANISYTTKSFYIYWNEDIQQLGLKSREPLPVQASLMEYAGKSLSVQEYGALPADARDREYAMLTQYAPLLDGTCKPKKFGPTEYGCISALKIGNLARFVNHRCYDSNLEARLEPAAPGSKDQTRVVLMTKRAIGENVELNYDYGDLFDDMFVCNCESREHKRGRAYVKKTYKEQPRNNGRFTSRRVALEDKNYRVARGRYGGRAK